MQNISENFSLAEDFLRKRKVRKELEETGIDPVASPMRTERSTI